MIKPLFTAAWATVGTDLTCDDGSTGLTLVPPNGKVLSKLAYHKVHFVIIVSVLCSEQQHGSRNLTLEMQA